MLSALRLDSAESPGGDPAATPPGTKAQPVLMPDGPGRFKLGEVRLDKGRRAVSFPAVVNLREGNVEYVVVNVTGKTHESVFKTEAQPQHVHLAMLLLGAHGTTNALPEDPAQPLSGTPMAVEVSWTNSAKTGEPPTTFRAETFVLNRRTASAARLENWVYTGSRIREDGFAAQIDGSIVSLITDPDALINNPLPGREDDDNWLVRTNDLPALGTPVEVTIRLADAPARPKN